MFILRLIFRHINRRRLQSILFVFGVALGVAVGVAIDLANTAARQAFTLSTESITGQTTHQIIGGPRGLDANLYQQIKDELGIQASAPVIDTYVRGISLEDQPLHLLGVDFLAEAFFRNYSNKTDKTQDQIELEMFTTLITSPNTVLISQTLADRFELVKDDSMLIRVNTEQVEVQIAGLLHPTDTFTEQALDDLLLLDIRQAQNLLNMPDRLTRIDLILPENYDQTLIRAILPSGALLTTPSQRTDALNQMTEAFNINLQALSLLALVVGVFLIYNTVMFSVVQRRQIIGTLRSLGTSKRQIFGMIIGEAFLLGFLGTALGLILGVLMGQITIGAVSQSISDLYFRINVQRVDIVPETLIRGLIIGIGASLVAALIPSLDATRTTPAGSMRRSDLEQQTKKLVPVITSLGIFLILLGLLLLQLASQSIALSFAGLFMVVIGAALFTPLSMIFLLRAITPASGIFFGILGRMAPRAVIRSLSRTSTAVAALTLSVSVVVGVGIMISSFRTTVVNWLDITLGADIFIATPNVSTDSRPNIDPTLIDALLQVEGIAEVSGARSVKIIAPDFDDLPPANLIAVDTDISGGARRFVWKNVPSDEDYRDRLPAGQIMVSEPFAYRRDITPENNTITLLTEQGRQEFEIFGVFYDYTSDQGRIMMNREVYRQYFDDPYLTSLGIFIEPDADLQKIIQTLRTETLIGLELEVQSNRNLRKGALEVFDRTFSITVALQILAIIVAFIGILNTLMALQLEHVREYGIMRANGMTPGQIRRLTLLQTGLMGMVSGLLALPIGLALAFILIFVINVRSCGWTMQVTLPPEEFIQAFLVALFASLAAGLYPAWRGSTIPAIEALRNE